jgi:hypothetical protein
MCCWATTAWSGAVTRVAVIGEAIEAKVAGDGHRRIAARLGVPDWMVRRWLRRFAERAVAIREHFTRWAHALDVSLGPLGPGRGAFADAVEAIGAAARAAVLRFGPGPVWPWAAFVSGGGCCCATPNALCRPCPEPSRLSSPAFIDRRERGRGPLQGHRVVQVLIGKAYGRTGLGVR